MKKVLALALALMMVLALASCGSKPTEPAAPPAGGGDAGQPAEALKVAMVCSGSLGDTGIFDMGEAALKQAAADFGVTYKVLVDFDPDEAVHYGMNVVVSTVEEAENDAAQAPVEAGQPHA